MLRYDISHPVVNDARMVLWRDLGVASWPTLLVVSPRGRVIASLPGAHTHAPHSGALLRSKQEGTCSQGTLKFLLEVPRCFMCMGLSGARLQGHTVSNSAEGRLGLREIPAVVLLGNILIEQIRDDCSFACSGEGNQQNVDDMLAAALEYYGERGMLDDTPMPVTLERERRGAAAVLSPLRYPGKLTADLAGRRLFISDSNNHRCVSSVLCSDLIVRSQIVERLLITF